MIDKQYCMSSYMAFRYIEKEDVDFYEETKHHNFVPAPEHEKILVDSAEAIDREVARVFEGLKGQRLGIMLSGGMDSASLASYMEGCDGYTFRFLGGEFQTEELKRAEYYAKVYNLKLHYVDIDWNTVTENLQPVMKAKGAPVHSIEPQLYQAALQAKRDGIERLIIGNGADYIFGGMDQLLSEDWAFDDFVERYMFTKPQDVLKEPADVSYLFEQYRCVREKKIKDGAGSGAGELGDNSKLAELDENGGGGCIDYLKFMEDVALIESFSSYWNAFHAAGMPYTDPYAKLKMAEKLDLYRIRHGEPKYLIRELFAMKYPGYPIPRKLPMPRPVDLYFNEWDGPQREEFRKDIDMRALTGNQKWQLYCLEEFLNLYEPLK